MRSGEAVWREVVGDELYEDEADRRAHEELERFHLIPQLLPDIHPPDI